MPIPKYRRQNGNSSSLKVFHSEDKSWVGDDPNTVEEDSELVEVRSEVLSRCSGTTRYSEGGGSE